MMGKSHMAAGAAIAVTAADCIVIIERHYGLIWHEEARGFIRDAVYPYLSGYGAIHPIFWWAFCAALYFIGLVLPDIDSEKSMLGRYLHLPFEHHTWTHTAWFLLPSLILARFYPLMFYLFAGYFVHLLCDASSACGVCWFYPISKYRRYPNGAKVKKGHKLKLYKTGQKSEAVVVSALIFIAVCMTVIRFLI